MDRDVVMEGKILTPLEGLEAVDSDFGKRRQSSELVGLEKQAVTSEARNLMRDRRRAAPYCSRQLSIAHAADHHHDDAGSKFGTLLPVGRGERLCTKVTLASKA